MIFLENCCTQEPKEIIILIYPAFVKLDHFYKKGKKFSVLQKS
jgi:hypothetical protein